MDAIPITWLVSVLLAIAAYGLAWNTRIPGRARVLLCLFLLCLVGVTVLLGMRVSFGWLWPGRVQPFVAVLAAPLAYLGFAVLTIDTSDRWRGLLVRNGVLVLFAVVALAAPLPVSEDVFILTINCIYLYRMAGLLRLGPDGFHAVAPHTIGLWRAAIIATLAFIGLMIVIDGLVLGVSLFAREPQIIALLTGISGLFVGFVCVLALVGVPLILQAAQPGTANRAAATDADRALMERLDRMMHEKTLFRDSSLTLARVARRLSIPARDLSGAINRTTDENFPRFINGYRIAYAQSALRETALPVTEVMLEAGFVSKSSFNTEFRRVTGQTPSQFRSKGAEN
ncbi:helix-turn-helix domain-containing protein [Sulfitobacter sp. JB4-11]|uniref:helix-turn-helix domain-containing protein n=1 Tax=Sulfitobacter rhodophyticola TaxID=3238304 RepID=UPI003515BAAF